MSRRLTFKQASADTDLLFRVLQHCYGPYGYFGGDAKFGKAKVAILADLKKEGTVSTEEFKNLLIEHLSFIQDTHFSIDNRNFIDHTYYLHSEETTFEKDENGFFKVQDGKKLYVDTVDGKDPAAVMKLSISPEGKLVYYAGGMYPVSRFRDRDPAIPIVYRSSKVSDTLTLQWSNDSSLTDDPAYRKQVISGIPVISYRRCYDKSAEDTTCEDFAAGGTALKDQKAFVLDIRGNIGGDDSYFLQWRQNYTGNRDLQWSATGSDQIELQSRAGMYILAKALQNQSKVSDAGKQMVESSMKSYQNGKNSWQLTSYSPLEQSENQNVIFVLVDTGDASSGEDIISELKTMKNVVIVGTNTAGCMLSNAEVQVVLPSSKLMVRCGNWLSLYNPEVFTEGTGFLPDIWNVGDDALPRLIAMIKYYRAR